MNKENEIIDLTCFYYSITWLEKYIEVKELLPNWQSRKQTDTSVIRRNWDKNTPENEIINTLGVSLQIHCACSENWPDKVSDEEREAYKSEFYKWIDATGINVDEAPKMLKIVIFAFHKACKDKAGGLKIHKEAENSKPELDRDSPEYQEQLQKTFSAISEAHASGKAYEVNEIQLNGNPEKGKKTFETIANSLTAEEKENFHWWPQMTAEEKAEEDRKDKERINRTGEHPILQSKKIHAINEVTQALNQEPKIKNNDLSPENQNWKTEIEEEKSIIKIQNLQNRVLADIQTKGQFLSQQEKEQKDTKTFLIAGAILIGSFFIIALLFYYRKKKNVKRK